MPTVIETTTPFQEKKAPHPFDSVNLPEMLKWIKIDNPYNAIFTVVFVWTILNLLIYAHNHLFF